MIIIPECNCPEGYTPAPDGSVCIKEDIVQANLPVEPLFCGNSGTASASAGVIYLGSINSYVWPIMTVPQAVDGFSLGAMTIIPSANTNNITGDSWTAINPLPQPGGQHSPITSPDFARPFPNPNPLGITPQNTSTPGDTLTTPYPFYQSTIVAGTLFYGQGSQIPFLDFIPSVFNSALPFDFTYYADNNVWKYTGTGDITYQWGGFKTCLNPSVETVYQVTFMANNGFRFFVDDNLALEVINGDGATTTVFIHAFEITLPAGFHTIQVEAYNYSSNGAIVCDILECSYAQFTAITTQAQLDTYRVFSTYWKRERAMTLTSTGTDIITTSTSTKPYDLNAFFDALGFPATATVIEVIDGTTYKFDQVIPAGNYSGNLRFVFTASSEPNNIYTCPQGYTLSYCDGITCSAILDTPCEPLPTTYYTLNDCCTNVPFEDGGNILYLSYQGTQDCIPGTCPSDIGTSIITSFTGKAGTIIGCFKLVEIPALPSGQSSVVYKIAIEEVTTVNTCEECQICKTYFELEDCASSNIVTTCTDLTDYVGYVIKLRNCPDVCWKVSSTTICTDAKLLEDEIIASYPPVFLERSCSYDISNVLIDVPTGCIASAVIYINTIPHTFPYTDPQTLAIQITSLLLGNAEYVVADKTIIITGTNIYENLVFVTKVECQNQEVLVTISISPTCINVIDYDCASCLPKPQPEPIPEPKKVRPGYFIKNPCLSTEYVEKVNCNFGNQVYDQMITARYGITACCEVDVNKWDIKKHIVDYELMTIPKEELYTPRTCYCYTITVTSGTVTFKYISCEGNWTSVTLTKGVTSYCSQNKPQVQCTELGVIYEITSSNTECISNNDCN